MGLRDRALISVMTFAFARIGAIVAMRVEDYYPEREALVGADALKRAASARLPRNSGRSRSEKPRSPVSRPLSTSSTPNKVFQYRSALRHPVVNEAVTTGLRNRFPNRS